MPVNVKELIIEANLRGGSSNTKTEKPVASGGGGLSKPDREVIIREAVRRVMEELAYKFGR